MRALEQQQLQEEQALLSVPVDGIPDQHIALSAPTTPPRTSSVLNGDANSASSAVSSLHHQAVTNGLSEYKRKSVNYASLTPSSDVPSNVAPGSHKHAAGAKSMPGSRRGSSGSRESAEDMTASLRLDSLSIADNNDGKQNSPHVNGRAPVRSYTGQLSSGYNAASLFDQDLDNEMSSMYSSLTPCSL